MLLKCRKSLFAIIGAAITTGLLASSPATAAEMPVRGGIFQTHYVRTDFILGGRIGAVIDVISLQGYG